jgi:transcriptional regulator of heat shock response
VISAKTPSDGFPNFRPAEWRFSPVGFQRNLYAVDWELYRLKLLQLRAMKFLKWLLIAVLFCGGAVHSARADEASKRAKIDQMLDEMHADQIVTQMIGQVNNMVAAQTSDGEGKVRPSMGIGLRCSVVLSSVSKSI